MASSMIWALILVSGSMNVSFSSGYPSEKVCKDALNVARTGKTVQEQKDDEEKARLAKAVADGKWRLEHPLRKPTAEDEKICSKAKDGYLTVSGSSGSAMRCVIEDDGLVHEYPAYWTTSGSISMSGSGDSVRWAKCVIVNPDDK